MLKLNDFYERQEDNWVSRFIMDEVVIMPLCRNEEDLQYIYSISNETGARIWQLLDGKYRVGDIQKILKSEYQGQSEMIEREVLEFLSDLFEARLIRRSKQRKPSVISLRSAVKKRPYKSPEIAKVKMQPEQAVLSCCTQDTNLKSSGDPLNNLCQLFSTPCTPLAPCFWGFKEAGGNVSAATS